MSMKKIDVATIEAARRGWGRKKWTRGLPACGRRAVVTSGLPTNHARCRRRRTAIPSRQR